MLAEAQLQELKHLANEADMPTMLTKIKELIPAYTGWPRKKGNKAGEFTTETQRGRSSEGKEQLGVELGGEAA